MKMIGFGSVVALAMAAVACGGGDKESTGSNGSNLTVKGTVERAGRSLDNASAIAIGSDGRTFSTYLDSRGRFSLDLPVGHTYRVIIANGTVTGGLHPVGHLVNDTAKGSAEEIRVREGGTLNLGSLRPAGTTSTRSLHVQCGCSDDEEDDSKTTDKGSDASEDNGDYDTKQKDDDKDNLCDDDATNVPLKADNAPGDKCAKGDDDEDAPKPSKKSCDSNDDGKSSSKDTSDTGKGDDDSGDWDDDGSDSSGKDSSGKDSSGKDSSGKGDDSSGGKGSGESCTCSSQCSDSCVAGKCTGSSTSSDTKGGK